jgi:hypothetical protein
VALVGDSHAWQWAPALARIAARDGWRLEILTKSSCGFFDAAVAVGRPPVPNTSCQAFDQAVREHLLGPGRPDVVISSGSNRYAVYDGGTLIDSRHSRDALAAAYERRWRELADAGIRQVVLRNTPWLPLDPQECAAAHRDRLSECAFGRAEAMARAGDAEVAAAARVPGVALVDLTDHLCPRPRCAVVIGGAMVWRGTNHLTATYARTMATPLGRALRETGAFQVE